MNRVGAISTSGDVQIIASSLTDSGTAGNTDVDVSANELAITTTDMGVIGASDNAITTTVDRLSAAAGDLGLFVTETAGLEHGQTSRST